MLNADGMLAYTNVYGEDPVLLNHGIDNGFKDGDKVFFLVAGSWAISEPEVFWHSGEFKEITLRTNETQFSPPTATPTPTNTPTATPTLTPTPPPLPLMINPFKLKITFDEPPQRTCLTADPNCDTYWHFYLTNNTARKIRSVTYRLESTNNLASYAPEYEAYTKNGYTVDIFRDPNDSYQVQLKFDSLTKNTGRFQAKIYYTTVICPETFTSYLACTDTTEEHSFTFSIDIVTPSPMPTPSYYYPSPTVPTNYEYKVELTPGVPTLQMSSGTVYIINHQIYSSGFIDYNVQAYFSGLRSGRTYQFWHCQQSGSCGAGANSTFVADGNGNGSVTTKNSNNQARYPITKFVLYDNTANSPDFCNQNFGSANIGPCLSAPFSFPANILTPTLTPTPTLTATLTPTPTVLPTQTPVPTQPPANNGNNNPGGGSSNSGSSSGGGNSGGGQSEGGSGQSGSGGSLTPSWPITNPNINYFTLPVGTRYKNYVAYFNGYSTMKNHRLIISVRGLPLGLYASCPSKISGSARIFSCTIRGRPLRIGNFIVTVTVKDNVRNPITRQYNSITRQVPLTINAK